MLAFLAGELSNSSTYFSSFGNVSKADCNDFKKNFDVSDSSHWKPWEYPKRLLDANKVISKKTELDKTKNAATTKRQKLTSFISTQLIKVVKNSYHQLVLLYRVLKRIPYT